MQTRSKRLAAVVAASIAAGTLAAAPAAALTFDATVSPTKSNGDFIADTGIPADGFTVDNGADGEQIGLKGEGAFSLDGVPGATDNRYFMKPGLNTSGSAAPGQGTWAFNFHYSPGTGSPDTDTLRLDVDFDPASARPAS